MKIGPVDVTSSPHAKLRTIPLDSVALERGLWSERQHINRTVSLRHGFRKLEAHGNFHNLRLAAGTTEGEYRRPVFMDSDVYKWLEAAAYSMAVVPDDELMQMAHTAIDLVEAAQRPDGYIDSYWQVVEPERRWQDLDHGHELYCAGHLIQAAVAFRRATGDSRLLGIAQRFADNIYGVFGPDKRQGTPGHPEIETALVELYRETGERRYLDLSAYFLGQRGHGLLTVHNRKLGKPYMQDRVPVRETSIVEGHAVRQLYLTAGVTDVYLETGEQALWDALMRQWYDFTVRKMYITGGAGARWLGEAFGEAYELPNDRAYCETCAQIASIHWNWRLLLATGDSRYADLMERTLYNGFLSGVSLDGSRFFYVNRLLSPGGIDRPEWHSTACCPPNVMRMLASLPHYFATTSESGIQIHQFAPASVSCRLPDGGTVKLRMDTEYPWQGLIRLSVEETSGSEWELSLRLPSWCEEWSVSVSDTENQGIEVDAVLENGAIVIKRDWRAGDVIELDLPMEPFLVEANPRVDATRDCVAIQRGPVVYCIEAVDQEAQVNVLDILVDPTMPLSSSWQPDLLGGVVTVDAGGYATSNDDWDEQLYRTNSLEEEGRPGVSLHAVPYHLWANRGPGAMRVWLPVSH